MTTRIDDLFAAWLLEAQSHTDINDALKFADDMDAFGDRFAAIADAARRRADQLLLHDSTVNDERHWGI